MANLRLTTLILVLISWTSFAFKTPHSYDYSISSAHDCSKISFREEGRVTNDFVDEEVEKPCHNIESANTTILSLRRKSSGCKYRIQAFSSRNCKSGNYAGEHSMNSESPFLMFNDWTKRISVCSLEMEYMSSYSYFISAKFLEPNHNDKEHTMYQTCCYNLCHPGSSLYHPYTIHLYEDDRRTSENYVRLFSKPECNEVDEIKYRNHTIAMVKDSANLVALTSRSEVLSYRIFPVRTEMDYDYI